MRVKKKVAREKKEDKIGNIGIINNKIIFLIF